MWLWPALGVADSDDIFRGFTTHIQHQIRSDKRVFLEAQLCTEWFYKQRFQKPVPPAEGIAFRTDSPPAQCAQRYPDGLEAARQAFGRTQSSLSLSLTFYEFALVGDRNDDHRYSDVELRDVLESCGLHLNGDGPPSQHLAALNAHFDTLHKAGSLDGLMAGMGTLYDKGYRFTPDDRALIDHISK